LWAVLLIVGGVAASEAYEWGRSKVVDPDQYLKELAAKQDSSFKELKKGLSQIGSAIGSGDREALNRIETASREIRDTNIALLNQLDLAKQENQRLSQVAGQQAGIRGGYDLMLTENTGLVLEPGVVLGVDSISSSFVRANLSADGAAEGTKSLNSGESLTYRNATGATCRVTLLSISGANGAASFSRSCG